MTIKIDIAKVYSRYPAGRVDDDGPFNGKRFRDTFLIPQLENKNEVIVELDNVFGYGSSFLDEAFGGLCRDDADGINGNGVLRQAYPKDCVKKFIKLRTDDPSLEMEIVGYIDDSE